MSGKAKAPSIVSVIGLGKLGAPMAAAIAARGVEVIGADLDLAKVEAVNRGRPPVSETGLAECLEKARGRLRATTDLCMAALQSEVSFIIVPTPSEPQGGFSLRHVLPALEEVGRAIRQKAERHVAVITCTVMPGATAGPIRDKLEAVSGKRAGDDFGLCYSPEFIALGSVIHDFLNPDFVLVGESDPESGSLLESFYARVCENDPYVARMNPVNAELAKLCVNTFVTTKISFANMVAHICEHLPGADVDVVTRAIGHDSRIGSKYLRGAVGYGGPCFPRDNLALGQLARSLGVTASLAEATDRANRAEVGSLLSRVEEHLRPGMRVGVLGLSYKPDTEVIEESQGLLLVQALLEKNIDVIVYDPTALESARAVLGDRPTYAGTAGDCARRADLLVIVTPWKEFAEIGREALEGRAAGPIVLDGWRIASAELRAGASCYRAIGVFAG